MTSSSKALSCRRCSRNMVRLRDWKLLSPKKTAESKRLPKPVVGTPNVFWNNTSSGISRYLNLSMLAGYHIPNDHYNIHAMVNSDHLILKLRKMISNAWAWGKQSNNLRTNEVHGEEEVRLVLADTFEDTHKKLEEVDRSGSIHIEDRGCLLGGLF